MQKAKSYRNLILGCCMAGGAMLLAFFFLYHTYIQDIIYEERLNQMEEITHQMFQNLEDEIDSHWDRVTEECNYLKDANIQTTDELCRHMKKKYELSAYADHKITLMAVDSEGGYYTESGKRGLFRDLDYFEESPEKTSFVFDSMTDNQSKMVFLNRLPEPIYLQNGEKKTSILYFGIAQDMEQLNPYFNCEAYNGNNSVYVLDDNGSKLFNSNQVELIKGHNVFSVLQNMKYLHNSSFEKTKAELEEKGCSYSNAVLDYITAGIGSAIVFLILLVLGRIKNESRMLLIVRGARSTDKRIMSIVSEYFSRRIDLRVENTTEQTVELIYEIPLKIFEKASNRAESIADCLYEIEHVEYVNVVAQDDDISN